MKRSWKRVKKYTYLIVFVMPLLVVLGVRFGGAAAWLTPFVAFVPVHWAVLTYALRRAAAGGWSPAAYAGNVWSMGILSGLGIVVAHELGHKPNRLERRLAKALLHPTFYGHFTKEHNLGHHLMVATPEDPATARFGESFWRFYRRTFLGTFRKSLALERRKLPNGKYERVTTLHSWNSNHLVTNGFLYHPQRHSDHHAWPARRCQVLRDVLEAPQLPTGCAGMILLAAVPPLWFRVMDRRVLDFRERQARSELVEGQGIVA